jgi:hypothetical protein
MQAQLAAERAEREAQEMKMADLIQFVSRMGAQNGLQLPTTLYAPPSTPAAPTPVSMNVYYFRLCFACLTHAISPTLCSLSRRVPITHLMRQVGLRTIKVHIHHSRGGQVGSDSVSRTSIWMMDLSWTCDVVMHLLCLDNYSRLVWTTMMHLLVVWMM